MPRRKLTDEGVAKLALPRGKTKTGNKVSKVTYPDPELLGHYIRVTANGKRTFVAVTLDINGKQIWKTVGAFPMPIADARAKAREVINRIKRGEDVAGPQSFEKVANDWFENHVTDAERTLRSAVYIKGNLKNHIIPAWSGREFEQIDGGDITKLLDKIKNKKKGGAGASAADKCLNIISRICTWYKVRHPKYQNPVVRGMRVVSIKERARKRILTDDEIRAVWKTAEANGQFGAFIRLLLLTGQRREKVAAMKWDDVSVDGTWTIPTEAREKGNADQLKLPLIGVEIIQSRPRLDGNPYVFGAARVGKDGKPTYFSGFSKMKAAFDKRAGIAGWVLHDLRRTARSLMSRAGVRPDIAERVLGHAIAGVEGVYDRHPYNEEKALALKSLAGLIGLILNPPADNVVSIAG